MRARSRRRRSAFRTCRAQARRSSATCGRSTRCSSSCAASAPTPILPAISRRSRSSCSSTTATTSSAGSSGSRSRRSRAIAKLRVEVDDLRKVLAHVDAGRSLSEYGGELPAELEPLTTKPLIAIENGPGGIDLQLEAELAELPDEEAAQFRDDGDSALEDVAVRLRDALDLITFFTAGEKETRAWTLRDGESALDAAESIHSDIARGFIRCEVVDWRDLVELGSHAEVAKQGKQRLEGKTYVVRDGDVLNIRFNV